MTEEELCPACEHHQDRHEDDGCMDALMWDYDRACSCVFTKEQVVLVRNFLNTPTLLYLSDEDWAQSIEIKK